jgi:hypothetical protein
MDEIRDQIFYPKPFKSFKVITKNDNNDPLVTVFYSDNNFERWVFKWTQTWFADGKCESWKVEVNE